MKRKKVMAYAKHNQNFFILNFIKLGKTMAVSYKKLKHIISKNKQI